MNLYLLHEHVQALAPGHLQLVVRIVFLRWEMEASAGQMSSAHVLVLKRCGCRVRDDTNDNKAVVEKEVVVAERAVAEAQLLAVSNVAQGVCRQRAFMVDAA